MEACHFPDRNPQNNNLSNLRWDTRKSNAEDRDKHGTVVKGEEHWNYTHTDEEITQIKAELVNRKRGDLTRIQEKYHISKTHLRRLLDGCHRVDADGIKLSEKPNVNVKVTEELIQALKAETDRSRGWTLRLAEKYNLERHTVSRIIAGTYSSRRKKTID